jgi:hypothetical protein
MLLKNKANRKEGRVTFNSKLAALSATMKEALAAGADMKVTASEIDEYIKTFDNFNIRANKLQNSYNESKTAAEELVAIIDEFVFLAEKKQKVDVVSTISLIERKLKAMDDKYFASKYEDKRKALLESLSEICIESRKNVLAILENSNLTCETAENRSEFKTDHTSSYHAQSLRNILYIKDFARCQDTWEICTRNRQRC